MSFLNIFKREKHADHNPKIYFTLTQRHFKVFFKNKMVVFFALLVPIITLIIYVVFLRPLEAGQIDNALENAIKGLSPQAYSKAHVFADAWMLSGITAVSCISVSLNTCNIMIADKQRGVIKDFMSSPISRRSVNVSYLLFNILATLLINFCVLVIAFIYLSAIGGVQMSAGNVLLFIPVLILSVISASLVTCFFVSFIQTAAIYDSCIAIFSSAVGFLIGAYMPTSLVPAGARPLILFFPGSYSAGLFRTLFLEDYFLNYQKYLIEQEHVDPAKVKEIKDKLLETFTYNIDFFGIKLSKGYMILALVIFIVLFLILNYLFLDHNFVSSAQERIKRNKKK